MEKIRKSPVIYLALQLKIFFQITKKNVAHNGDTWCFLYLREDAQTPNKSH